MEADWEIEIGADAPVIDAYWAGFVDLRVSSEPARLFPETVEVPALAEMLMRLNAPSSPVWTSKCDLWQPETFDPDELDATPEEGSVAIACYVDLLPRTGRQWLSPMSAVGWCKSVCSRVHTSPLRCSRADLIIRRALQASDNGSDELKVAITAYLTACGPTHVVAVANLSSALTVFADSIHPLDFPAAAVSKLQWESVGE
jgi:hypothetical protein